MFGGGRTEMVGEICHKFFGQHKCPIIDCGQAMDREERKLIKSDGTVIPIQKSIAKIQYNGRSAFIESFTDISYLKAVDEQKRMLEVAEQANEAKSSFLANMSHEMRTPLNAVIGLTQLSLGNNGLAEETRLNLEKVYNAGATLLSIVNDVLDISKIEAGRLDLVEIDYDVPSLINDTVTQNILRIGEKPIEFKLDIGEDIFARLYGDELRLKQIMNNLLSNAIKYTQKGSVELSIYCDWEGTTVWLTIKVRDTGKGIRSEDMDKLFSDYFQTDIKATATSKVPGLDFPSLKSLPR
jgi:signal transduction histidine kinase